MIDYMMILETYLNERLFNFNKKVYLVSNKKGLKYIDNKGYGAGYCNIREAIYSYITNEKPIEYKSVYNSNSNGWFEKLKVLQINEKDRDIIEKDKCYLYELNANDFSSIDNYGCKSDKKRITVKKCKETTLQELLKSQKLKFKYVSFSKDNSIDKKFINKMISTFNSSINKFPELKRGFEKITISEYSDDIEDFAKKLINQIDIFSFNMWDVSDNARLENEEIMEKVEKILDDANKNIIDKRFCFTIDGDWDTFEVILKYR